MYCCVTLCCNKFQMDLRSPPRGFKERGMGYSKFLIWEQEQIGEDGHENQRKLVKIVFGGKINEFPDLP